MEFCQNCGDPTLKGSNNCKNCENDFLQDLNILKKEMISEILQFFKINFHDPKINRASKEKIEKVKKKYFKEMDDLREYLKNRDLKTLKYIWARTVKTKL